MGGKGSKTQETKTAPWEGAQPFLVSGDVFTELSKAPASVKAMMAGVKGVYPEASRLYDASQFSPQMQQATDTYTNYLQQSALSPLNGALRKGSQDIMAGAFDQRRGNVGDTAGVGPVSSQIGNVSAGGPIAGNYGKISSGGPIAGNYGHIASSDIAAGNATPGMLNISNARAQQGFLDPTLSLSSLMSGNVNTAQLDPLARTIANNVTRNTTENILPQIRSGAIQSGQYGGSRQGIAEGLAASRAQQDIATATAPMYQQAFENAQNRQLSTAGMLNQQAENVGTSNINRDFAGQQFNIGNNLAAQQFNSAQNMAAQSQNEANRMAAQQFDTDASMRAQSQNEANRMAAQQFDKNQSLEAQRTNVANRLAALGLDTQNALNTQQFNANLGLQNNQFALQQAANNLNNRMRGLDVLGVGDQRISNFYNDYMNNINRGNDYNWQQLANYANIVQPGASVGGTQSSPMYRNTGASAVGGALSGAATGAYMGSVIPGIGTGIGAAVGGGLGLLGGLF